MFHQSDVHSMCPKFAYNVHSKYISMSSLMHILLIAIQVTFYSLTNVLWMHIFYVHCFVATVHLKYCLMYIWCAFGRGSYMYFWMHFSHYNVINAMYIRCVLNLHTMYIMNEAHFNVLINAHCIDCDVGSMSN